MSDGTRLQKNFSMSSEVLWEGMPVVGFAVFVGNAGNLVRKYPFNPE